LELPFVGKRVITGFVNPNGINQVVKSTPEIMDKISEHETPSFERSLLRNAKEYAVSGKVWISFSDESVMASVIPGDDFILDGFSMVVAPS
jgi:hypothetical protein